MRTRSTRSRKWIILPAILLALVTGLLFTPLGAWLTAGATQAREGFVKLPGIAWARRQLETAPRPAGEERRPAAGSSEDLQAILRSGFALQEEGKLEEAVSRYREALELDEEQAPTHAALAGAYLQLGREDEALQELERAAELAPENAFVLGQLGQLYLRREEFEKSVAVLERAKAVEPDDSQIRSLLGAAYYYRSYVDAESAVAELAKAAELGPEEADVHFHLAMAYMRRDDPSDAELAIHSLNRALELDPSQSDAYYYLGQLYAGSGQWDAATDAWQRYVSLSDDAESVERVRSWLRDLEERRDAALSSAP